MRANKTEPGFSVGDNVDIFTVRECSLQRLMEHDQIVSRAMKTSVGDNLQAVTVRVRIGRDRLPRRLPGDKRHKDFRTRLVAKNRYSLLQTGNTRTRQEHRPYIFVQNENYIVIAITRRLSQLCNQIHGAGRFIESNKQLLIRTTQRIQEKV
jgi:hypothetical protein